MAQKSIAQKKNSFYLLSLLIIFIFAGKAFAQPEVHLSIRAGGSDYVGVNIDGFEAVQDTSGVFTGDSVPILAVRNTLANDLDQSGIFKIIALHDSLKSQTGGLFAQLRNSGAKYYLFGKTSNNGTTVNVNLVDLKTALTILGEEYIIHKDRPWHTAHVIADDLIELFGGLRGSTASQIAYMTPYKAKNNEIFLIDADGRGNRQLSYSNSLSISPNWSPDGKNLVFSTLTEENWVLRTINVSTGRTQDISDWPGQSLSPSFSPVNPDIIAFSASRDGNNEIYTCRTDGKNLRRLTNHYKLDLSPTWSPDGKKIAFTSDRSGQPMIYVMNSDGSGVHRLTDRLNAYEGSPCWSPRGDRLVFVVLFDRSFDIATASPSGDDTVILTSGPGSKENPRWSPDGLKIVYTSTVGGSKNLYIMNSDGSNVRLLTKGINNFSPAWAPASSGNDTRVSSRR
jgi:TolB protein